MRIMGDDRRGGGREGGEWRKIYNSTKTIKSDS